MKSLLLPEKGRHDVEGVSAPAAAKGANQLLRHHRIQAQTSFHHVIL